MYEQKENKRTKAKEWVQEHQTGLKIGFAILGAGTLGFVIGHYVPSTGNWISLHFPTKESRDAYMAFSKHTAGKGRKNHYSVNLTKANMIDELMTNVIPDIAEDADVNVLVNVDKLIQNM